MPKVSITINRSSEIIWDYLKKPKNWKKWWGASISSVNPGWQNGDKITWENGDKSDLPVVRDQQEIQLSSRFMKTSFFLRPKNEQTTSVEYEFNPSGGASFSDGGRAHQATVEKNLAKLKDCLENETAESPESVPKKWWHFWK
jgi:uncharacterized protein YndB with AHSA1/START domain